MSQHIVSLGDLVLDVNLAVTLPVRPREHQEPSMYRVEPGGAANFMIMARHLGLAVSAAGTLGDDVFGEAILQPLRQAGINLDCVSAVPGSTTTLVIVLTDQKSGEHVFLGHYGEGEPVAYPAGLDARIDRADGMYMQGYTLAEARVVPLAQRALERAVVADVPIFLDAGPFLAQVPQDLIRWAVARSTVILTTEDEVPLISGGLSGYAAYRSLLDEGPHMLVIKQGPGGCLICTADWEQQVPGFSVPVVDTVGAGDCFDAGFVVAMLKGWDYQDAAILANAVGAAAVQKIGAGSNAPTRDEIQAVLYQAGYHMDVPC
ncbi:MAG: carbohydrate kinase family protein [Anaerolineae bacterium]|nr:carbohydrate kinase family protein [Anaerolineae bacterium]